jgi:H+/Cl- antiporter ClcA
LGVLGGAIVVGALAAVAATAFLLIVETSQEFVFHELPQAVGLSHAPWWWAGVLLVLAAAIVMLAQRMPGATGSGPLTGFHFDVPLANVPAILLAAIASLVGGVALGPEAPLIVIGTSVGAILGAKRAPTLRTAMMFIGGAAAISAVFGNPFITAFMILEFMAFGVAPVALLLPMLTGLASSYLVSIGLWGIPGLGVHTLAVPGLPAYPEIEPGDLLAGIAVALIAGAIAVATRKAGAAVDALAKRSSAAALFGAAAVSTLVLMLGETVFGINQDQILFSGNSGMGALIAQTSIATVLFILMGKAVVYSAALGSGFRGGPIFPVTFLGVAVGVLGSLIFPDANVSALAAAGIAASAAAFLKLPATSALLGAVLIAGTGGQIAPFAILGAVVGFAIRLASDARTQRAVGSQSPV